MTTINPWINFNGNAEEAFNFYKSVLGGEFTKIVRFKDLASPDFQVPEAEANKLMQIVLKFDDGQMLVGNDVPEFMGKVSENENRSKILLGVDSKEDGERIFSTLSESGSVEGPFDQSPWGTFAGMFRDKYGIEWIIEFNPNK